MEQYFKEHYVKYYERLLGDVEHIHSIGIGNNDIPLDDNLRKLLKEYIEQKVKDLIIDDGQH